MDLLERLTVLISSDVSGVLILRIRGVRSLQ